MDRRSVLRTSFALLTGLGLVVGSGSRRSLGQFVDRVAFERLRRQLVECLSESVGAWFPRTLDTEHGGFLCDFDEQWRPNGPHRKRLEFQARQLRAAAQAALFDGSFRHARAAAEHGFRYLADVMWDKKDGGWFYLLHRDGGPVYGEKHLHGIAYAIEACIAYHDLTGRAEALELARAAFRWLDEHAHDRANGGYFPYLRRDGTPIVVQSANGSPVDFLNTPIGLKDSNATLDLVSALADLFEATSDRHVGRRLHELLSIVRDRMLRPPGIMFKTYTPDWRPADDRIEIGVLLQASCTLHKAADSVSGSLQDGVRDVARALVDACLRHAWDERVAGFRYEGRLSADAVSLSDQALAWWVQAEGMRALLRQALADASGAARHIERWLALWELVKQKLVDRAQKGWRPSALSSDGPKSYDWKDASHEVRAMIECARMLERATKLN